MLRARSRGRLLRAKRTISSTSSISGTSGRRRARWSCSSRSTSAIPANPLFLARSPEIQDVYQHDVDREPGDLARAPRRGARTARRRAGLSEAQARLGIARQLEALQQTDDAIEMLQAVIALRPPARIRIPAAARISGWVRPMTGWAGAAAVDAYRAATLAAGLARPQPGSKGTGDAEHLRRAPDPRRAERYRLFARGLAPVRAQRCPSRGGIAADLS